MDTEKDQTVMQAIHGRVVDIQQSLKERNLSDHDLLIRQTAILEQMQEDVSDIKKAGERTENAFDGRLRVLEQAYWKLMGAAALAGAVTGFLAQFIRK